MKINIKIETKNETRMSSKLFSILLHLLCYFRIQIDDTNSFFIRIWQALWFWSKKCKEIFPVCEGQVSCISLRWAWPVIAQKNKIERSRVTWKPLIRSAQKHKNCPSEIKKKQIFLSKEIVVKITIIRCMLEEASERKGIANLPFSYLFIAKFIPWLANYP